MSEGEGERSPEGTGRPTNARPSVRATLVLLVLVVLVSGGAYPEALSEVAHALEPSTAGGSLLTYPNGTAYGSSRLGQNITNPALFWLRPSLIDDQAFSGAGSEIPLGPTDPALRNETLGYIALYGLTNTSVPIDLVSPSASGLDPDITPAAALVQVPRVSHYSGLNESFLTAFVNARIQGPTFGVLGPQFVNVVELDVALLSYLPPGTGYSAP